MSYAGDVTVDECWQKLTQLKSSQLIDVRTSAEWSFVGLTDLHEIEKQPILIEWQQFPTMQVNPQFVEQVEAKLNELGCDKNSELFFLCRSGVRSISAAQAMTAAGYPNSFNILAGFEGDKDANGHRGMLAGWKYSQKPWSQ